MRNVLVRVGGKDYRIPQESRWRGNLVMVTENPAEKGELLVWRLDRKPDYTELSARVGTPSHGRIEERIAEAAVAHYDVYKDTKIGDVWHMLVSPKLRRKTVGTAMREMVLRDMRDKGARFVTFPYHRETQFYAGRGMKPVENPSSSPGYVRFGGKMSGLGVKPKGIKLKVLWKKANPRLSR